MDTSQQHIPHSVISLLWFKRVDDFVCSIMLALQEYSSSSDSEAASDSEGSALHLKPLDTSIPTRSRNQSKGSPPPRKAPSSPRKPNQPTPSTETKRKSSSLAGLHDELNIAFIESDAESRPSTSSRNGISEASNSTNNLDTEPELVRTRPRKPNQPTPSRGAKGKSSSSPTKSQRKSIQNTTADVSRRTRRLKTGTKFLQKTRALQSSTRFSISKASFRRVVLEIIRMFASNDLSIKPEAEMALQEAAELFLIQVFQDSQLCCLHAKRATLQPADLHLARRLRGPTES